MFVFVFIVYNIAISIYSFVFTCTIIYYILKYEFAIHYFYLFSSFIHSFVHSFIHTLLPRPHPLLLRMKNGAGAVQAIFRLADDS